MSQKNTIPEFWSLATVGSDTVLTYAIRTGKARWLLALLGTVCVSAGGWGAYWLLAEGELTIFGIIFILLVPGAAIAFGLHCLGTVFLNRTRYTLRPHQLVVDDYSLLGRKAVITVPRSTITHIAQHYFPPSSSSPSGASGTWTTFVFYDNGSKPQDIAFEGMGTEQERDWLGPMLAQWADKPLRHLQED